MLFFGAALSPSFTYTNEERGNYEAEVFRVDKERGPKATVEDLIREEPDTSDREVSSIQPGPEYDEITITLLNGNDGRVKTAYFYRMDLPREENSWICRMKADADQGPGLPQTLQWCLSFLDDSYRPTVRLPDLTEGLQPGRQQKGGFRQ